MAETDLHPTLRAASGRGGALRPDRGRLPNPRSGAAAGALRAGADDGRLRHHPGEIRMPQRRAEAGARASVIATTPERLGRPEAGVPGAATAHRVRTRT